MYSKFIKLVVLLSLLVCCGFAGRVLYIRFFNLVVQGKDPRHSHSFIDIIVALARNNSCTNFGRRGILVSERLGLRSF